MARHLTELDAERALRRGKPVDQLLGFDSVDGRLTIRWLTISPWRDGAFVVSEHHVVHLVDFGVYELAPVDPTEQVGEGRDRGRFEDIHAAFAAAASLGACGDRWTNFGVLADEVEDHRPAREGAPGRERSGRDSNPRTP
jgi:hypothetical protein